VDDLGDGQGEHQEVGAPGADQQPAHRRRQQPAGNGRCQQLDRPDGGGVLAQQGGGVGAGPERRRLAERRQPADPGEQVKADGQQGEGQHPGQHVGHVRGHH
jgi:hypothetical protein